MSLMLDLNPRTEGQLRAEAARKGLLPEDLVRRLVERQFPPAAPSARELIRMSAERRRAILEAAAEDAAPLYAADLSRPPYQRELTALTALDGEEFSDGEQ